MSVVVVAPWANVTEDECLAKSSGGSGGADADVSTPLVAMGTLLVIGASFISCFGVNLQKLAHNKNASLPVEDRVSMYKMWQWWLGIFCMIMGSVMDMAALPFVPLSRVAALGASTMVANIVITPLFLKETLTRHDLVGCALAVSGTVVACLFGAGSETNVSSLCLLKYFSNALFIMYFAFVLMFLMSLYYLIIGFRRMQATLVRMEIIEDTLECVWLHANLEKLHGVPQDPTFRFVTGYGPQFYPCVHAVFAGTIGAQSVMFAKAVLKFLGNAIYSHEDSTMKSIGYMVLFLLPTGFCLYNQITYLNVSLQIYRDALFVLPVYQALWVSAGILSGLFFYQEYREIKNLHAALFGLGCFVSLAGLMVLARRECQTEQIVSPLSPRATNNASPALLSARSADHEVELFRIDEAEEDAKLRTRTLDHSYVNWVEHEYSASFNTNHTGGHHTPLADDITIPVN
eukprot:TRINITY_DN8334_c0_g1_i1.p1 TRINITY_DN8334_c0_g1~~TRINITY_DN8334_c0_g1_i1.p1  ORF type:complete len:460 (+),score=72.46 TRINITY_DN8334_c0_g1_i1:912-2291(+)